MKKGINSDTVKAAKALRQQVRELPSLQNKKVTVQAHIKLRLVLLADVDVCLPYIVACVVH